MTIILVGGAAAVGGFVFGVLFGRRNTKKVEAAVAEANAVIGKLESEIKAIKAKV